MAKISPISLRAIVLVGGPGCVALGLREDSYHPQIDPANFQATVDNPYFPLIPGTTGKIDREIARRNE